MENPYERIKKMYTSLTKKEQALADYILENPVQFTRLTAQTLAEKSHSSKSALIRLCQKIGYDGYSEFRFHCSGFTLVSDSTTTDQNERFSSFNVLKIYQDILLSMPNFISTSILDNFTTLLQTSNRIKIFGINRTGLSAQQFKYRMLKVNIDSEVINDASFLDDILPSLHSNDLFIFFSTKSDFNMHKESLELIQSIKCNKILITMEKNSRMHKYFDHLFILPSTSHIYAPFLLDNQLIFQLFTEIILSHFKTISNSNA